MIQSISPKSILFHLHRCCQLLYVTSSSTHESWPFKPNPKVHRKKSQEVCRFSNYEMSHGDWGRSFDSPQVLKHECIHIYIHINICVYLNIYTCNISKTSDSVQQLFMFHQLFLTNECLPTTSAPGHVFEKALLCSSIRCNLLSLAEVPGPAIWSDGRDGSPDLKESRESV